MTVLVNGENILKLWKIDTQYLEQKEEIGETNTGNSPFLII